MPPIRSFLQLRPWPRSRFNTVISIIVAMVGPSALGADIAGMSAVYDDEAVRFSVAFGDPASIYDGWQFQLFIDEDTDERTGYGPGFEKLVRGVEDVESGWVFLRLTEGGTGPGGWGETVGETPNVRVRMVDDRHLEFDVPIGSGGVRTGLFRFSFESYFDDRLEHAVRMQRTVSKSRDRAEEPEDPPTPDGNDPGLPEDDPPDEGTLPTDADGGRSATPPRQGFCGSFGSSIGLMPPLVGLLCLRAHRSYLSRLNYASQAFIGR